MGLPVHIEGYAPPHDPRINVIRVAPDPGVIEVNIHPAASWDDCVATTEAVYEEARQCRLGADKFMIDGRHTGTGGGNHVVVGGETPNDWPFLRRPDLLRSLILHWQRHPVAVSYLFSGLFIGPTSQAPRIDEARHDTLYELEIALAQIPDPAEAPAHAALAGRPAAAQHPDRRHRQHPPRRDLHRQAVFARRPDRPAGPGRVPRLRDAAGSADEPGAAGADPRADRAVLESADQGHARPAGAPRCTTASCCRISSGRISSTCCATLRDHGFTLRPDWFEAQAEFRFPFCGEVEYEGVHLELRQALEPWHVLGERGAIGGTVRYTDSSVERLQVKLTTADPGALSWSPATAPQVPMTPGLASGVAVGGVRFKAWQPAEALHPVLPVNAPLTFDIYRHLDGPGAGRLHLSRRPSRRAQLRNLPGQWQRGRGAPPCAVREDRPYRRSSTRPPTNVRTRNFR